MLPRASIGQYLAPLPEGVVPSAPKPTTTSDEEANMGPPSGQEQIPELIPSAQEPASSVQESLQLIVVSVLAGVLFGFAMEKSKVFQPETIRAQMDFSRWVMLKMFLTAAAVTQLGFCALFFCERTRILLERARKYTLESCTGMLGTIVGGWVLGTGMSIAGACPGMVVVQVGANLPWSWLTLVGCLLGAFVFSAVEPYIRKLLRFGQVDTVTLNELLGLSYPSLAVPMGLLMLVVVAVIEYFCPWKHELGFQQHTWTFEDRAWPPEASGTIVGLVQLPLVLVGSLSLGSSTAYVTACSVCICENYRARWEYLTKFDTSHIRNGGWQLIYLLGAGIGGLVAAVSSEPSNLGPDTVKGVHPAAAILGGMLMVFGSRCADGCTSGHGLSGMSFLGLKSFIAVMCMFGGGISTLAIMKGAGIADSYEHGY